MKIRISIDGSWEAEQFSSFFGALERIHIYLSLSREHKEIVQSQIRRNIGVLFDYFVHDRQKKRKVFLLCLVNWPQLLKYQKMKRSFTIIYSLLLMMIFIV